MEFTYKGYTIRYSPRYGGLVADDGEVIVYGFRGGYTWEKLKREIDWDDNN